MECEHHWIFKSSLKGTKENDYTEYVCEKCYEVETVKDSSHMGGSNNEL